MAIDAQGRKLDSDMELVGARIQGLNEHIEGLENQVLTLADSILRLTQHLATMAETVQPVVQYLGSLNEDRLHHEGMHVAVSGTDVEPATNRKVWVAKVPPIGDQEAQVLIEQFGDKPPTVAFRSDSGQVWGRPFKSEAC